MCPYHFRLSLSSSLSVVPGLRHSTTDGEDRVVSMRTAAESSEAAENDPPELSELRRAARPETEGLPSGESDKDADTDAEPAGSGPKGQGPGLRVGRGIHERGLQDGAGLCSPGRWMPADRPKQTDTRLISLGAAIRRENSSSARYSIWAQVTFDLWAPLVYGQHLRQPSEWNCGTVSLPGGSDSGVI